MLKKRYIKSIKRDIFVLISFPVFLFQFLFCYILERTDKKWLKRDIIVVLISFLMLFVLISFLVNIGKKCPFRGSVRMQLLTLYNLFYRSISLIEYGEIGNLCL